MITVVEVVQKHFNYHDIRDKGREYNIRVCPFCRSEKKSNQFKFFINKETGVYCCQRGSCGASGNLYQLAKHFGEDTRDFIQNKVDRVVKMKKEYSKPSIKLNDLKEVSLKYIKSRGITEGTINHFKLKSDAKGNIIFPYYDEGNIHRLNKIRIPRKFVKDKDKTKIWQEGNGKPILFNMNNTIKDEPLLIIEGEWDCMVVHQAGYKNVVSVPFGTNNVDWIDECWKYLEQFKHIILWFDNDYAGKEAVEMVGKKLGVARIKLVENVTECKDANEILFKYGADKIIELINKAEFIPVSEVVSLADCYPKKRVSFKYGISLLDRRLQGAGLGELVIWTGKRGGGKSTILNQTIVESVAQKVKTFVYSGELSNGKVREWLERQIATEKYIENPKDLYNCKVSPALSRMLGEWYRNYIFTYSDDAENNEEDIFKMMEYAYMRYDIRRFVLDNLKTVRFTNEKDFYRSQGKFVNRLKQFAKSFDVHIDLVVHPRKTSRETLEDEDVGGSVDIIDLADNVVVVGRVTEDLISGLDEDNKSKANGKQTFIAIKKNREFGDLGKIGFYNFNSISKRIWGNNVICKIHDWEQEYLKLKANDLLVEDNEDSCPF